MNGTATGQAGTKERENDGNDQSHICAAALWWDRWSGSISFTCAGNPGGLLVAAGPDGRLNFRELAGGGMVLGALKDHDLFQPGRETLTPGSFSVSSGRSPANPKPLKLQGAGRLY